MISDLKTRLMQHLQEIVRERDPYLATGGHFYVQQYVRSQLARYGKVVSHEFHSLGQTHTNLVLELPARSQNTQRSPIVIGAHYDAVPGSPGADDNASGVAVLLELARLFQAEPLRYPLQLIAFDLEEHGLIGSQAYAAHLSQQHQKIRLMISLEMLGYRTEECNSQRYPHPLQYFYPDRGNYIGLIGNLPTLWDLIVLKRAIKNTGIAAEWLPAGWRGLIVPDARKSDHAPFWDRGDRAMMVTDTAHMRNPHYHQPSDRIETLDLDFMAGICLGLAEGLRRIS